MSGYVRAHRQRFDHPLFRREKFCRGYAWDWLVSHACWKAQQVDVGGKLVTLQRGQLCYSIRFLAGAWNWDKAAVSRFLERLKTEAMIDTQTETGQTIISICNYDRYQADATAPETANGTEGETAARQQRDKEEEGKKGKEDNPLTPKGDDVAGFDEFWAAWPLAKTAKAKAQAAFKKLKAEDRAKATEAVVTWAANWRRQHPTASDIHATTYLNQKRWEDEATAPAPGLRVVHSGPRIGDVKIINGNPMEYAGNGTGWIRVYA